MTVAPDERTAPPYLPLQGVRVLDLSRLAPGALATRKLADLGAEVVKVEHPDGGDYLRTIPPTLGGEGVMHLVLNRGKKSIAVDFTTPPGRDAVERLAAVADVIVESSRPGTMARLGLDVQELRRRTPTLVVCSITGFGQDGPLAMLPSHGMNMDALAGCVLTSALDGRPAISEGTYTSIGTELGGVNAALAIVAAVLCARSTGRGAWIDASCWDAAVESHRFNIVHLASTGRPFMDLRGMGPLYDVYTTADGRELFFGAIEQKFWVSFCEGVGRLDLLERWRGGDAPVHFAGDAALRSALEAVFAEATGDEWAERFAAWEVPGSLVMSVEDVLESDHLRARGLLRDGVGDVAVACDPMRWMDDSTRPGATAGPCSPIGADTHDVMNRWLSEDRTPGHDPRPTTRGGSTPS